MTTTTKQPTLTVDQVMYEEPCYERDHVEQLWAGRDALTAREIAALDIAGHDRLWALVRLDVPDRLLHTFGCDCADAAIEAAKSQGVQIDQRSRHAIAVKRAWIDGRATDAELTAAGAAARAAVKGDAARAAAWAASRDAWAAAAAAAKDAWAAAEDVVGEWVLTHYVELVEREYAVSAPEAGQ